MQFEFETFLLLVYSPDMESFDLNLFRSMHRRLELYMKYQNK